MHAFRRLLLTELRNRRNMIMVILVADILLNAAVTLLIDHTSADNFAFITLLNIVIFACALLIPFLHCFSTWREEWKQHSIYQLLSLPVPRTYLILSKYISILLEILIIIAVTIIGLWVQYWLSNGLLFRAEPLLSFDWSKMLLVIKYLLTVTSLVFLCSMSVFFGKWFSRLSFLITFVTFLAGLLLWIVAFANFPSFLTLLVMSLIYFIINLYLLEKKVGV